MLTENLPFSQTLVNNAGSEKLQSDVNCTHFGYYSASKPGSIKFSIKVPIKPADIRVRCQRTMSGTVR